MSSSSFALVKKESRAKKGYVADVYKILTKNTLSKNTFDYLPHELLKKVLEKYRGLLTYELRDWIPQHKLNYDVLSENHNAIDFLILRRNQKYINYHRLSCNTNPKVVELLKERILKERVMTRDEYIRSLKKNIDWFSVSKNTILIEILNDKDNIDKIKWGQLSANPEAFDILLANESAIDFDGLSANLSTRAIKYLSLPENRYNISWAYLSGNPSPNALKLLSLPENYENIVWEELSGNTNIYAIQLLKRKWEEEKKLLETEDGIEEYLRLKERDEVIVWNKVCKNHSAISLLRTKIAEEKETSMDEYFRYIDSEEIDWRIDWSILSGNKGAIRLLRKKIAEENKLSDDEYDRLEEYEKIDWAVLCGNISPEAIDLLKERLRRKPSDIDWEVLSGSLNPRAIELLDANQDKIFWGAFSSNTSARAMELLKGRVLLEKRLEKEGKLSVSKKNISWIGLSRNPSIFTIQ